MSKEAIYIARLKTSELIGKRFGKLTVVSFSHLKTFPYGKRSPYFNVICDCGVNKQIQRNNLFNEKMKTISCGCHKRELTRIRHSKTRTIENTIKNFYTIYKREEKKSIKGFDLTIEDFQNLVSQNCHYCKSEPPIRECASKIGVPILCNGIDRVNSDLGYILENCVLCCSTCNYMKHILKVQNFKDHIAKIATFQKRNLSS